MARAEMVNYCSGNKFGKPFKTAFGGKVHSISLHSIPDEKHQK